LARHTFSVPTNYPLEMWSHTRFGRLSVTNISNYFLCACCHDGMLTCLTVPLMPTLFTWPMSPFSSHRRNCQHRLLLFCLGLCLHNLSSWHPSFFGGLWHHFECRDATVSIVQFFRPALGQRILDSQNYLDISRLYWTIV